MKSIVSLLIAAALLCAGPVLAKQEAGARWQQKNERMKQMSKNLQLTKAQRAELKKIKQSTQPQREALRTEIRALRKQMKELSMSGDVDQTKAKALIEKQTTLMGKIMRMNLETKQKVYAVLTPEQQKKLKEMVEKRMKKKMQMRKEYMQKQKQSGPVN